MTGSKKKTLHSLAMNKDMTMTADNLEAREFANLETKFAEKFPAYVLKHKQEAMSCFDRLGYPNTKDEEWRFTPILSISKAGLSLMPVDIETEALVEKNIIINSDETRNRIVFVDGNFSAAQSSKLHQDGLRISRIDEYLAKEDYLFNSLTNPDIEPFSALNTAFFNDGICIEITNNANIEEPIIIENIFTANASKSFIQQRNMLVAGTSSKATFVFEYKVIPGAEANFNLLTECFVEENAHIEIVHDIQTEHILRLINNTFVSQKRDSVFSCNSMVMDGELVRNNLQVRLEEKNAVCYLNGLYLCLGSNLVDNHLAVHHLVPNCESHQLYKGILKDKSHGVFNGKIFVHQDAQKTNAYQSNKNLVLSDEAVMNTKPQLEIFADDVKCSHGATIGQLDENAKFYLMARGISKENATSLLTYAFASDVLDKISDKQTKGLMNAALQEKLGYSFGE